MPHFGRKGCSHRLKRLFPSKTTLLAFNPESSHARNEPADAVDLPPASGTVSIGSWYQQSSNGAAGRSMTPLVGPTSLPLLAPEDCAGSRDRSNPRVSTIGPSVPGTIPGGVIQHDVGWTIRLKHLGPKQPHGRRAFNRAGGSVQPVGPKQQEHYYTSQ